MTSRVWTRVLCLVLCFMVLTPILITVAEAETTKVATYLLRLREKPSEKAKVLDAYPRGTKVTILKKGDTWTKVKVRGKVGYMKTNLLAYGRNKGTSSKTDKNSSSSSSGSSSSGKSTSISTGSTAYVIKGIRLNLRAEAKSNSDILGSYRGGTKVTVLKKGRFWSLVEVKGQQGYMANDYLTTEKGQ